MAMQKKIAVRSGLSLLCNLPLSNHPIRDERLGKAWIWLVWELAPGLWHKRL